MFHHSLESIQTVAADDAAGDDRTMVMLLKTGVKNRRRDANLETHMTGQAVSAARRLPAGAGHALGEAEGERHTSKRFDNLSPEETLVVFGEQKAQIVGMNDREVRRVEISRLAQRARVNLTRSRSDGGGVELRRCDNLVKIHLQNRP